MPAETYPQLFHITRARRKCHCAAVVGGSCSEGVNGASGAVWGAAYDASTRASSGGETRNMNATMPMPTTLVPSTLTPAASATTASRRHEPITSGASSRNQLAPCAPCGSGVAAAGTARARRIARARAGTARSRTGSAAPALARRRCAPTRCSCAPSPPSCERGGGEGAGVEVGERAHRPRAWVCERWRGYGGEKARLSGPARAHSSETTRTIGNDQTSVTPRRVPMASSGPPAETASPRCRRWSSTRQRS